MRSLIELCEDFIDRRIDTEEFRREASFIIQHQLTDASIQTIAQILTKGRK